MTPPADDTHPRAKPGDAKDEILLERLRAGDEAAFVELIDRHQISLRRFLRNYVPNDELAEDVAQETWIAVLKALDRFEGRSSLKTWIFRIGAFRAQSRMRRERRTISFGSLKATFAPDDDDVELERLLPSGFSSEAGMWTSLPTRWDEQPEAKFLSDETVAFVRETIRQLSPVQASVITLRDIEQWTAGEVCEALDLSEANQRVILHRARMKVRKALESRVEGGSL